MNLRNFKLEKYISFKKFLINNIKNVVKFKFYNWFDNLNYSPNLNFH